MFSLGICVLYMITFVKFNQSERKQVSLELYKEILDELIEKASKLIKNEDLINVIKKMVEINPKKRHNFIELETMLKGI